MSQGGIVWLCVCVVCMLCSHATSTAKSAFVRLCLSGLSVCVCFLNAHIPLGLVIGEITTDKMLVVLNKCDLLPPETRDAHLDKLKKGLAKTLSATRFAGSPMVRAHAHTHTHTTHTYTHYTHTHTTPTHTTHTYTHTTHTHIHSLHTFEVLTP